VLLPIAAAVRYRRWRNGVASGRLPDGTTSSGSSKEAAITMTAGELFRLEENEGFVDIEERKQLQKEHKQEQQQVAVRAAAQQEVRTQA
jgi:maltoporin